MPVIPAISSNNNKVHRAPPITDNIDGTATNKVTRRETGCQRVLTTVNAHQNLMLGVSSFPHSTVDFSHIISYFHHLQARKK